tara:strand:- start:720 stop:863 length:144 start_codon:yes stop_codon:yes gene_type:complete
MDDFKFPVFKRFRKMKIQILLKISFLSELLSTLKMTKQKSNVCKCHQ